MSRDGYLPPGVEHCDIPGERDKPHCDDCPMSESNDPEGLLDDGCTCYDVPD